MAIGTPTYNGGATTNAGGTSLGVAPSTAIPADSYVLLVINRDNNTTTDGDNSEVTGVTDTQGNTWTKLKEMTNGQGGAAAGAMISVWGCRPAGTYGTTVATATFAVAQDALALYYIAIPIGAGLDMQLDGSATAAPDASTGFGTLAISGLVSANRAYISACCKEGNGTAAITATSGFTSFGLTGQNGPTVTATNHIMYRSEYKVATSTGETSNPTWATTGDAASVFLALSETSTSHTLTGSGATQANTSPTGAITQTQTLTGTGSTQDSTSATGAITQPQILTGNSVSQANTSPTGAISLIHTLTGAGSTQANTSPTGAIAQTQTLTGAGSTQANTSPTGAITQTYVLTGAVAAQANTSPTGAITQTHALSGSGAIQPNKSSTGGIFFGVEFTLSGLSASQANSTTTGEILVPPTCPDQQPRASLSDTDWDNGSTTWDYPVATTWDYGVGVTCVAVVRAEGTCDEVTETRIPDGAVCPPTITPRM